MKYIPLYNLIIRGYHKSWVIIRVSIYKPHGVALTFASLIPPPSPHTTHLSPAYLFSLCSAILPGILVFFSTMSSGISKEFQRLYLCACHGFLWYARKASEIRPIGLIGLRRKLRFRVEKREWFVAEPFVRTCDKSVDRLNEDVTWRNHNER